MGTALLHLSNSLRRPPSAGKNLNSLPIPPNIPQQRLSPSHKHNHVVDHYTNYRLCPRRFVPMYTCRFVLEFRKSGEVYQFSGIRVLGGGSQHF
jgi:hypothetical protein